ncbi:hypothetical protein RST01_13380 [Rummeliibacillus stabekisii]|nr:hypothetical protein RST01_13380 [Rummeliibacillus stabekisii]
MRKGSVFLEKITFFIFNIILAFILFFDFFVRGSNFIFAFLLILLVVVLILNYYFSKNEKFRWTIGKKQEALVEALIATCMMVLIVIFYLLGGRSQHGVDSTGYVIWILYLLTLGKFFKDYKENIQEWNNE